MIQRVLYKKKIVALIIKPNKITKKGPNFLTPTSFTQQLGVINYPKNHNITPHTHKKFMRKVYRTSEVLFVQKGVLRVDFYGDKMKYFQSRVLKKGDIIFLHESNHGFKMLKDCSIIEIKQGPYVKLADKVLFSKVDEKKIKIKK